MPASFWQNQGVADTLWELPRYGVRSFAFYGSTTLAPTVATGASWALTPTVSGQHAVIKAARFSTDTAIALTTMQGQITTGLTAGTFRGIDGSPAGVWTYQAQVANPTNLVTTFGRIFVAANTVTDLLMGGCFTPIGNAILWQTSAVAANCTLELYWIEFGS